MSLYSSVDILLISDNTMVMDYKFPKFKLEVECIPESLLEFNFCQVYTVSQWNEIKGRCFLKAGYKCQVCGKEAESHDPKALDQMFNCREIWQWDDKKLVQRLIGFIMLCRMCYYNRLNQFPFHHKIAEGQEIFEHYISVNRMTKEEAFYMLGEYSALVTSRSKEKWHIDFGQWEKLAMKEKLVTVKEKHFKRITETKLVNSYRAYNEHEVMTYKMNKGEWKAFWLLHKLYPEKLIFKLGFVSSSRSPSMLEKALVKPLVMPSDVTGDFYVDGVGCFEVKWTTKNKGFLFLPYQLRRGFKYIFIWKNDIKILNYKDFYKNLTKLQPERWKLVKSKRKYSSFLPKKKTMMEYRYSYATRSLALGHVMRSKSSFVPSQ